MLNFSELGFGVALLYIRFPESESDFLCFLFIKAELEPGSDKPMSFS
jgi:hypothetical protein